MPSDGDSPQNVSAQFETTLVSMHPLLAADRTPYTITLRLEKELRQGSTADVWELGGQMHGNVAKIYTGSSDKKGVVSAMATFENDTLGMMRYIALYNDSNTTEFAKVLFSKFHGHGMILDGAYQGHPFVVWTKPNPHCQTLADWRDNVTERVERFDSYPNLSVVALRFARAAAMIHSYRFQHNDMSDTNVMVNPQSPKDNVWDGVYIIDLCSATFDGEKTAERTARHAGTKDLGTKRFSIDHGVDDSMTPKDAFSEVRAAANVAYYILSGESVDGVLQRASDRTAKDIQDRQIKLQRHMRSNCPREAFFYAQGKEEREAAIAGLSILLEKSVAESDCEDRRPNHCVAFFHELWNILKPVRLPDILLEPDPRLRSELEILVKDGDHRLGNGGQVHDLQNSNSGHEKIAAGVNVNNATNVTVIMPVTETTIVQEGGTPAPQKNPVPEPPSDAILPRGDPAAGTQARRKRNKRFAARAAGLLLALIAVGCAGVYMLEEYAGYNLLERADYWAGRLFESHVPRNPHTAIALGIDFLEGRNGLPRNAERGLKLLSKVEEYDIPEAQYRLGLYYLSNSRHPNAFAFFKKAAEKGHVGALNYLGVCYEDALGCSRDMEEAAGYYLQASNAGSAAGAYNYGRIIREGIGRVPNPDAAEIYLGKAHRLFVSNSANLDAYDRYLFAYCLFAGYGCDVDLLNARINFEIAARSGVAKAQNLVGQCYQYGWGMEEKDLATAIDWFYLAADQGNPDALLRLGDLLASGEGFEEPDVNKAEKNYNQAFTLYEDMARKDIVSAQRQLANCYFWGKGKSRDLKLYADWFQKAADQGDWEAKIELGYHHLYGRDGEGSLEKARMYFGGAAEQLQQLVLLKDKDAEYALADLYASGLGVPRNLTKARELYEKSAHNGFIDAKNTLGAYFRDGTGGRKDLGRALILFQDAAENDSIFAMENLGDMYRDGQGVERDAGKMWEQYDKAFNAAQKAAAKGDARAYNVLGRLYDTGKIVGVVNHTLSRQYYQKLADLGDPYGRMDLGFFLLYGEGGAKEPELAEQYFTKAALAFERMYQFDDHNAGFQLATLLGSGLGVPKDVARTTALYKELAEKGHVESMYEYAQALEKGSGVTRNRSEAIGWHKKAAENGDPNSMLVLYAEYASGRSGEQNEEKATALYWDLLDHYDWLSVAGDVAAGYQLAHIGDRIGNTLGDGSRRLVLEQVTRNYSNAANANHAKAMLELAEFKQVTLRDRSKLSPPPEEWDRHDWYERAAEQLINRSTPTSYNTNFLLGNLYHRGLGLPRDFVKAEYYYKMSAAEEDVDALNALGELYLNNEIPPDYAKAYEYFSRAAEKEHGLALYNQGFCLERGLGVTQNLKDAAEKFRAAVPELRYCAALGDSEIQYLLGKIYIRGQGVSQNYDLGEFYLRMALQNGNPEAIREVAKLTLAGLLNPDNYAPASDHYNLASQIDERFAIRDDISAQYRLGRAILNGNSDISSLGEGLSWIERAAAQGSWAALWIAGQAYWDGVGCEIDKDKSRQYFEKYYDLMQRAADAGNGAACNDIGSALLSSNEGLSLTTGGSCNLFVTPYLSDWYPKDETKARYYFNKGAELGDPYCQVSLGMLFLNQPYGEYQATIWLEKAKQTLQELIELGDAGAMRELAHLCGHRLAEGAQGAEVALYHKAFLMGDITSARILGSLPYAEIFNDPDSGIYIQFDTEQVLRFAASAGDSSAAFELGKMLLARNKGINIAIDWYHKAARHGDSRARVALAERYLKGDGVDRDHESAVILLQLAASQGSEAASKKLEELSQSAGQGR